MVAARRVQPNPKRFPVRRVALMAGVVIGSPDSGEARPPVLVSQISRWPMTTALAAITEKGADFEVLRQMVRFVAYSALGSSKSKRASARSTANSQKRGRHRLDALRAAAGASVRDAARRQLNAVAGRSD